MDSETTEPKPAQIIMPSRRGFLIGAGSATVLLFGFAGRDGVSQIDPGLMQTDSGADLIFDIVRPDDALVLKIYLYNLNLIGPIGAAPPSIIPIDSTRDSYLVAAFPDQSVGEEVVPYGDPNAHPPTPLFNPGFDHNGYRALAFDNVQPTRLVFKVTGELNPSLESGNGRNGLLDWIMFQPQVTSGITSGPPYSGPGPFQTSIGAPFGMALSPPATNTWVHSTKAVADPKSGITEIWHTRLAVPVPGSNPPLATEYPDQTPQVNAVASNNFVFGQATGSVADDTDGVQTPITAAQRAGLVLQTSDYFDYAGTPTQAVPAEVRRLMLTSNGAWLDLHGSWPARNSTLLPARANTDVTGWSHHSTHGRDHEVVVTEAGYLLPFGHAVTMVNRSVRMFETGPDGTSGVANLRYSSYLIIRKQDRDLENAFGNPNGGRELPFKKVRINASKTPNLNFNAVHANGIGADATGARWCVGLDNVPYQFDVTAWDHENRQHHFSVPMMFVSGIAAVSDATTNPNLTSDFAVGEEPGSPEYIAAAYNSYSNSGSASDLTFVTAQLHGQPIALAESATSGDTALHIDAMTFNVEAVPNPLGSTHIDYSIYDEPRIFPQMLTAQARIPTVQAISPGATSAVSYFPPFVHGGGFSSANPGEIFLNVDNQSLSFNAGGHGTHPGVVTPNMSITGLSRKRGPVGGSDQDLANYAGGAISNAFNPKSFFSDAKVLGGLDLGSIIYSLGGLDYSPLINTLRTYPLDATNQPDLTKPPILTTSIEWQTSLVDSAPANPVFKAGPTASLRLLAMVTAIPDGKPPMTDVSCELRDFTLQLFGDVAFLTLDFAEFSFHARNGAKPTVKPHINNVTFGPPLNFINALEQFLPSGPGGNGIFVTDTQVQAKTSVAIPSISFGVFSLTNLSLNSEVDIPFSGAPARVAFDFCTRDNPFQLSVLIFGGGGFVGLWLGTNGMQRLEASFEFGAHMGIDIGIASGSIEVMAGVYFAIGKVLPTSANPSPDPNAQSTQLTGFVKAHGELNLAVVAVSITFYMSLTYQDDGQTHSVWGEVDVSLDVRVLIFSVTVHFSVRKEFSGGHDPAFADMYTSNQWSDYALAFA